MNLQKWLAFLSSCYRPLSRDEEELVSLVHSEVTGNIKDLEIKAVPRDARFERKNIAVEENLRDVINRFKRAEEARKQFRKHFGPWGESRKSCIKDLQDIADLLHSDRYNSNIRKVIGSAVGIVGGAAAIGSLFFPPLIFSVSTLGGIASGLGSAAVCGASAVELISLKNRMEKAKTVLEEDRRQFAHVGNWFETSSELLEAIEQVIGFTVTQTLKSGWQEIWDEFENLRDIMNRGVGRIRRLIDRVMSIFRAQDNANVNLALEMAPVIISLLFVLFSSNFNNGRVFDCAIHTQRLCSGVLSGLDATYIFLRAAHVIGKHGGKEVVKITPRFIGKLAVAGTVGIALETVNIVLTSTDLANGSTSQQEEDIRKVIKKLKEEYNYLEEVYEQLEELKDGRECVFKIGPGSLDACNGIIGKNWSLVRFAQISDPPSCQGT